MGDAPDLTGFAQALLAVEGEPERALEVECGDGEATLFLAREYPRARVRGLDSAEPSARAAASRVGLDPEGRVAFKTGRPDRLPFPDDHFDLVVQRRGRIAHAELCRVTRQGGQVLLRVGLRARGPLGLPGAALRGDGEFVLMRLGSNGLESRRE